MPYLLAPGLQAEQPQYLARLDPNHPLYQDIVFAYSAGRGPHDGCHGPASITGTVNRSTWARGKRVIPADASSFVNFPASADYNTLGGVTIIALIRTTTAIVSQQGLLTRCETGGGTNTPWALLMEGNAKLALNRANAGFRVWSSPTALSNDTDYAVAVSQGANISVAPRFYINGAFDTGTPTSLYSGSGTGAPTGNTTSVKLGNRTDLATQSSTFVYDALVLKRVLTDAQIADLSRSVWQVWEPEMPVIWFFPGASGGTTYNQSIDGSITPAGALTRQTNKAVAGSSTPAGALSKLTSKAFAGSVTGAGELVKQTAKAFAGSVTGSGALSTMILFTASMGGSITPSGAIAKMTIKALAGASTFAGAISKMTAKGLGGEVTVTGALSRLTAKAFAGSVTVAGALTESYQVLKSLAGSITPTGALGAVYIAFVAGVLKLLALMGVGQ